MSKKDKNGFKQEKDGTISFKFENYTGSIKKDPVNPNNEGNLIAECSCTPSEGMQEAVKSVKKAKKMIINFVKKELKDALKAAKKDVATFKNDLETAKIERDHQANRLKKLKKV